MSVSIKNAIFFYVLPKQHSEKENKFPKKHTILSITINKNFNSILLKGVRKNDKWERRGGGLRLSKEKRKNYPIMYSNFRNTFFVCLPYDLPQNVDDRKVEV